MTSATTTAKNPPVSDASQVKAATPAGQKGLLAAINKPRKIKEFSKKELVDLFRGLGSMLRAQINTADALKYYGHGLPNKAMVDALMRIREDINSGMNVHEAFRRTGRFSETIVGLIQAGSDAGQLHHAFQSLAGRLEERAVFPEAAQESHHHAGCHHCRALRRLHRLAGEDRSPG